MASMTAALPRLMDRPASYKEMAERPDFVARLEAQYHELREVLSDYYFAERVPCGLSTCRQPHNAGFLVVTQTGEETNVGSRCGRIAFGESFDVGTSNIEKRRQREGLLDRAAALIELAPSIKSRIGELSRGRYGIRWSARARDALREMLGEVQLSRLQEAQRRSDLAVLDVRERTPEEIDRIVAEQRIPREAARYDTQVIGSLEPMPWLQYDYGEVLREGILRPLEALLMARPEDLPTPKIKALVEPLAGWEGRLGEAEEAANSVIHWFSPDNLRLLELWVPRTDSKRRRAVREWASGKLREQLLRGYAG